MNDLYFSLFFMAGALIAGYIGYFILSHILKKLTGRVYFFDVKPKLDLFVAPLQMLWPVVFLGASLPFLRFPPEWMDFLGIVLRIWFIAGMGWVLIRAVYLIRDIILQRYDITTKDNLYARRVYTQIRVIENIVKFFILFMTLAVMAMTFPNARQIGVSLLASAGIVGIIIGFAAQKALGNVLAGIQIAFAQPIRIDDVVIVENEWGRIEEIALTYVVVRIWDLRRLVVPISYFIENPFQNWTRVSADLLCHVSLFMDYTVPVDAVREELTRILNESLHWDKKVNVLQVVNATERTVEIRALMSAADSSSGWNLRCEVREKLLTFLQKNYPEALPKARLEIVKGDAPQTGKHLS